MRNGATIFWSPLLYFYPHRIRNANFSIHSHGFWRFSDSFQLVLGLKYGIYFPFHFGLRLLTFDFWLLTTYLLIHTDTYVKIKVISSKGKRIGRSKTTTRRNNSDPEYNETFVYTMSVADLKDATMMFTLYGKDTYSLIFNFRCFYMC